MSRCICVPKESRNNRRCPQCFPEPRKSGHDKITGHEKRQRQANGLGTGEIMNQYEPRPEDDLGVDSVVD